MKLLKSIENTYNKLSTFGKILIFTILLLIIVIFFKHLSKFGKNNSNELREGFMQSENFLFKEGEDVYDDFYAGVYDHLVYNQYKNDYEIGMVINNTGPTSKSVIADIGCGTGHQVAKLNEKIKNIKVIGIDISPSMVKIAKENYPQYDFQVGNALNNYLFQMHSLTHILCLYFTIYFIKDKMHFFYNCVDWLMPGGFLILHLVDRERFDPILPPGNPLFIVSPQKYAKKRITHTKVTFNDFVYISNFNLDTGNDKAIFEEKFKFNNGSTRKQDQVLYMEDTPSIVNMAQEAGLNLHTKIDMVKCAYEYQYLYIFVKPN